MEIKLGGGVKGGSGFLGNGGIRQSESEHGCTVYCYAINVRPVLGVGEGYQGASRDAVVVIVGN